ncbi:MAG: hypothetical protein K2Q18_09295 [Bdellovibrionales bacterium]|nr:hypothetical protein [Bdellovibrionales bacterium]
MSKINDKDQMKKLDLEKFIQNLSTDLYSFAFILIPDDLQATQLMIDAVSTFLIQKKSLIAKWSSFNKEELLGHGHDIKIHLYKSMYELSKKRYSQLRLSFKDFEENSGYFSLEFDDKAALFLKERTNFSVDVIEFILGQSHNEVIAHLYSARRHLLATTTKDDIIG